jgi:hypothetical protein
MRVKLSIRSRLELLCHTNRSHKFRPESSLLKTHWNLTTTWLRYFKWTTPIGTTLFYLTAQSQIFNTKINIIFRVCNCNQLAKKWKEFFFIIKEIYWQELNFLIKTVSNCCKLNVFSMEYNIKKLICLVIKKTKDHLRQFFKREKELLEWSPTFIIMVLLITLIFSS